VRERLAAALEPYRQDHDVAPYRQYLSDDARRRYGERYGRDPCDPQHGWPEVVERANRDGWELHLDEDGAYLYTVETANPYGQWDYWYFYATKPLLHRQWHRTRVVVGQPELREMQVRSRGCHGGPKESLDLESVHADRADVAGRLYDRWLALTAGLPPARPWRDFYDELRAATGQHVVTRDQVVERYRQQPRVRALVGTELENRIHCQIEYFQPSRNEFVAKHRRSALVGSAMVTTEGWWLEPDDPAPGWVGYRPPEPGSFKRYARFANDYIDALPDDAWIFRVGCHG